MTIHIGKRLVVGIGRPWDWKPYWGVSRRSEFFCGGFYAQWLCFSLNYDHLSRAWRVSKSSV